MVHVNDNMGAVNENTVRVNDDTADVNENKLAVRVFTPWRSGPQIILAPADFILVLG